MGPKTDAAIRDFETSAKLKVTGEASEDVLRARGAVATYVVSGGKTRRYTKPLKLKRGSYYSVDRWGNAEKPRPIRSRS